MKKIYIFCLIVSLSCGYSTDSNASSGWIIDVMPAAITASLAADNFSLTGSRGQEEMSLVSSLPNIGTGIYIDTPSGYIDLHGGIGMLLNSRLRSTMFYGSCGMSFEIERSAMFGPHIGMTYFASPDWWGDGVVELDDSTGLIFGLHLTMGDKISYILSADYIHTVFDVKSTGAGWTASDDEIDLSGLAVQFGFRAQF